MELGALPPGHSRWTPIQRYLGRIADELAAELSLFSVLVSTLTVNSSTRLISVFPVERAHALHSVAPVVFHSLGRVFAVSSS